MDVTLIAALLSLGGVGLGWVYSWLRVQREHERMLLEAHYAAMRQTALSLQYSITYRPAPDDDPAPDPDPADTRPLGPLPDEVTRTLGQQEA